VANGSRRACHLGTGPALWLFHDLKRTARVLVVDDNPTNRKLVISGLRDMGVEGDEACNGYEALAACHRMYYDLILMD
jgi:CheY-like chemotaxis protein